MPARDKMNRDERRKYLLRRRLRDVQGRPVGTGQLLDEMVQVTELRRKSLVRRRQVTPERKARQRQRGCPYNHAVDDVIRGVVETLASSCAERLTPSLLPTTPWLIEQQARAVSAPVLEELGRIRVTTVQRILGRSRQAERRWPRRGPERAMQLRREMPAERSPWDLVAPGTAKGIWCSPRAAAPAVTAGTRCR